MTIAFGGTAPGPLSPGIESGDLVFLSGQVGVSTATGQAASPDVVSQTRETLLNIKRLLRERELQLSDLVSVTVYLTDIADWAEMNSEYLRHFEPGWVLPTRTAIAVSALPLGAAVEMTCIASRGHT